MKIVNKRNLDVIRFSKIKPGDTFTMVDNFDNPDDEIYLRIERDTWYNKESDLAKNLVICLKDNKLMRFDDEDEVTRINTEVHCE